jgi:pimeloyl-ACP methyl ester carboxylesterase
MLTRDTQFQDIGHCRMAYRTIGSGEPLLMIHGFPLHGMTWRHVAPALAERFTCHLIDLPGAGETRCTPDTDFGFKAQARSVKAFADALGLTRYSLVAHDTGATIARQLAIIDPGRVKALVAIGTEIPHHRPPWIQVFQACSGLPGFLSMTRANMRSDLFLRSSMGFGGVFSDLGLLRGEFHDLFIEPVIRSAERAAGQRNFLRGIDWKLVDSLAEGHATIEAPVLLIWGEDDPIFPLPLAKAMVPQFRHCRGLEVVRDAKTFVHEERPEIVARLCLDFL